MYMAASPRSTNGKIFPSLEATLNKTEVILVSGPKAFFAISLALAFSGCSTYVQEPSGETYSNGIHVIAQVCLPNTTGDSLDPFDISFSHIKRYGPQGQYRSMVGGSLRSSWRTKSNQLVFEQETGRQIDVLAIVISFVNLHGIYARPEATFGPPENIPAVGWSQWIEPVTLVRDTQSVGVGTRPWQALLNYGRDISAQAIEGGAPKIRYRLIRVADYQLPFGSMEAIPSCY
jgi:hypothetical protein